MVCVVLLYLFYHQNLINQMGENNNILINRHLKRFFSQNFKKKIQSI